MATKSKDPLRVVTGKVRLSFVHLFEKHTNDPKSEPRYSVMLMIPKKDKLTLKKIRAAEKAAAEAAKDKKWGGRIPRNLGSIIKDGDEMAEDRPELYEAMKRHWCMTVGSTQKVAVVDEDIEPIMDASEVYSGIYARASIRAFGYSNSGNNGVSFGLNSIQKLSDGEPLGGSASRPEDDYGDDLDDDEDFDEDDDDLV